MGAAASGLKDTLKGLRALAKIISDLNTQYRELNTRLNAPPGLPRPSPTEPYWLRDPPFPELVDIQSPELPSTADVVVIGSGITGAAVARALLLPKPADNSAAEEEEGDGKVTRGPPRVVVLEARQLCSGATGRNGGHIKASPHEAFARLRNIMAPERAAELVRFQLRHLETLTSLCREEAFGAAECREVETVDLFLDEDAWDKASGWVDELKVYVPEFEILRWTAEEAQKKFGANSSVIGAMTYRAGALWPYRFVSSIWHSLVDSFPSHLHIETSTPATDITVSADAAHPPYAVHTPRGTIHARHVVHATNGFASHLIPGLRGKLAGAVGHMSAQRPGTLLPDLDGSRSWSVIYKRGFDYVTQRPSGRGASGAGELMLGGGWASSPGDGLDMLGNYDDTSTDAMTTAHLLGVFPAVFGPAWGDVTGGSREREEGTADLPCVWSGVLGIPADYRPFVGRLDPRLTGRKIGGRDAAEGEGDGVAPGEWVSAGYLGDGMVWAWLCGTALGDMVRGREVGWMPRELLAGWKRVKEASMTTLLDELL